MSAASSAPPFDDPLIGTVLGDRYRVERCLGAGGVGVVYEATHLGLGRPVAIKLLKDALDAREDTRLRFEREAQILSRLSHPNVVALSDYGVHAGAPYFVMERLRGMSLAQLLRDVGPPPVERARKILEGVLRALIYAHERGILHRDLKPGNVFLQALPDDAYHVRLLDFGLAKVIGGSLTESGPDIAQVPLTRAGYVLGTPAYMAPEQASGGALDARSDVYAAGVLLFELLTGRPPFQDKRRSDLLRAHMVREPPSLSEAAPGLAATPELEALVRRALAKDAADRFASAEEMMVALSELPAPMARSASLPLSPGPVSGDADTAAAGVPLHEVGVTARSRRGQSLLVGAVAAVLLALVALGAAAAHWFGASPSPGPTADAGAPPPAPVPARPLADLRSQVEQGEPLSAAQQRELRRFQRAHPEDAAASLLLARDAAARGWYDAALQRYAIALDIEPQAGTGDAVLEDLVAASTSETVTERARGMVRDLFGRDAIPAVRRALRTTRGRRERARLRTLLRTLTELPEPDAG